MMIFWDIFRKCRATHQGLRSKNLKNIFICYQLIRNCFQNCGFGARQIRRFFQRPVHSTHAYWYFCYRRWRSRAVRIAAAKPKGQITFGLEAYAKQSNNFVEGKRDKNTETVKYPKAHGALGRVFDDENGFANFL